METSVDDPVMRILEEMIATQEEILEQLEASSKVVETDSKVFDEMRQRAAHYSDVLKSLSKDMIDVCERVDALKKRLIVLNKK